MASVSSKVPKQLQTAKRRGNRPIAEQLPSISAKDIAQAAPHNWHDRSILDSIGLRYSRLKSATISRAQVDFVHTSGLAQTFRLKWIKTGFGKPRAAFICSCRRPVTRLYFHRHRLACRRCCGAIYASQCIDSRNRPALQATRLRAFLNMARLRRNNRYRLNSRLPRITKQPRFKRLEPTSLLPISRYSTQTGLVIHRR